MEIGFGFCLSYLELLEANKMYCFPVLIREGLEEEMLVLRNILFPMDMRNICFQKGNTPM